MKTKHAFSLLLTLSLLGFSSTQVPWTELTESDWMYALATRFSAVDGHRTAYPTPPAELARLLEGRQETAALRALADARMALGDRPGALAAMEKWAAGTGPEAWAETARWAAAHQDPASAFRAAAKALPGLPPALQRSLADEQIRWADQRPDQADPIALRKLRADLFPADPQALEAWLRALERAKRLPELDQALELVALAPAKALTPERALLLRSDLQADHGDHARAFQVLDAAVAEPWTLDFRRAYAQRADRGGAPLEAWRATLDKRFDPMALVRLATYLQGKARGEAAADLLRQMDRRYGPALGRKDWLLLARLCGEIDAVPEAFRARLAAAQLETDPADLAALARLALKAGGRPLAWGGYNDEAYLWVAALDRTPGFWTGAVSFLLTGQRWQEAMDRLESESLPDRTFATAQALAAELIRRAPQHPDLPTLRVAIMERHVERGEGAAALALLPLVEAGPPAVADDGRRVALLAARQTQVPLTEELRLMRARLRYLAADGSRPDLALAETPDPESAEAEVSGTAWQRPPAPAKGPGYNDLLNECVARLETRDRSHRGSLDLILGELDRLPAAENLWLNLASRLEGWSLDDELGPRYEQALTRFQGSGIWARSARWYAKRNLHAELRRLAEQIAGQFRGAAIFEKVGDAGAVRVEIPEQPALGGKVRMVLWADWIRFQALKRFPQSPTVFREAAARLVTAAQWQAHYDPLKVARQATAPVLVDDSLMEERRWAILFAEPAQRELYFHAAMQAGTLETGLAAMETQADRGPMQDLLLFEGWSRLSHFERAAASGDRLALAYPGDGPLAQRVLSLHRSLNALEPGHADAARTLVARAAKALENPGNLWTELGEMEEERGHPEAALPIWQNIVDREPGQPDRVAELATLLWDYGHDREALAVVEAGRKRLNRPRYFAFETGVLRENLHDLDGAVREYLDAVRPEDSACFCSWFERDQRSLRRLSQLLGRERVFAVVAARIKGLRPGVPEDERILAACLPLASIEPPDPGLAWDADSWIDQMDQPMDPVGREQRKEQREAGRPGSAEGIRRMGDLMLEKSREMVRQASQVDFLDALDSWSGPLVAARWQEQARVTYQDEVLARRAKLAPSPEDGLRQEVARAGFLATHHRVQEADAVWAGLDTRISSLPEGAAKLRAESERAGYLERAKGAPAASSEWQSLTTRYPWSLGLLEARLDFLGRTGQGAEGRALLETVVPTAGTGHRQALLERLTRESLAASDLPRARRAVVQLLAEPGLDDPHRLGAVQLLTRLSLKENPGWNPLPLAQAEAARLKPELHADLYHELAQGADLEGAWGTAQTLWIEALNRRTEREWLQGASRSAARGGKGPELLAFFEKQQHQSPRDVRWAVAVRDIRRAFHQVDGAIAAAKAAVAVRPEQEILWREAAEIMVRADQPRAAADFLEGWNRPRLADEGVARWRGELYAQAGDGERALAQEAATLAAYRETMPAETNEWAERQARAAERLLGYGYPALALRLCSPNNDVRELAGTRLAPARQCEIAMLNGQLVALLARRAGDTAFRDAAARYVGCDARPEVREEVQAWLLTQLLPAGQAQPTPKALGQWWPFLASSGLERGTRLALAQRLLDARVGPWQQEGSLAFTDRVGAALVVRDGKGFSVKEPDLWHCWAQELARRDESAELVGLLEPRWQELLGQVRGPQDVTQATARQPWSAWLDDPAVLEAWLRGVAARPDKLGELAQMMGDQRSWNRFWALAARKWATVPLVAVLPREVRINWFGFTGSPMPAEPRLQARRATVEAVTLALGHLLKGEPGAVADPLITRLRGPRTVGDVLGKDAQWTWPDFSPRRNDQGVLLDQGEDRILGQGADEGRLPGALWGSGPGEAWYVLETLARYRQGDPSAALLPTVVPQRGQETERAVLALRLARALKALPLGLELEAGFQGPPQDRAWLEARLTLLQAAGQRDRAQAILQAFVRAGQPKLTEATFRWLSSLAEGQGLAAPLTLMDPAVPVGPAFLAYLTDRLPMEAPRFKTADVPGMRAALGNRWRGQESKLSQDQLHTWLKELWATDSAPLPRAGLRRLGGLWPAAGDWLQARPVAERLEALELVAEATAPAQPRLLARLSAGPWQDQTRLLAVRIHLARGGTEPALALVDELLAAMRGTQALAYAVADLEAQAGEGSGDEEPPSTPQAASDPFVDRIKVWLAPFKGTPGEAPAQARFRKLLQERLEAGQVSTSAWTLALGLSPAEERANLAQTLEQAWFRGEVPAADAGALATALVPVLPAQAPLWLTRWPRAFTSTQTLERAAILVSLKDAPAAAQLYFDTRSRASWPAREERKVFHDWRRHGALAAKDHPAPAYWTAALACWGKGGTGLGLRLKAHPQDFLAARAALRDPAPVDPDTLFRVDLALAAESQRSSAELETDQAMLRLKTARHELLRSWRSAKAALGPWSLESELGFLADRRVPAVAINQVLADLARLASRGGDTAVAQAALGLLTERKASDLPALRAELARDAQVAPDTFLVVDGKPKPLRPRDLTWAMLANVLKAEVAL